MVRKHLVSYLIASVVTDGEAFDMLIGSASEETCSSSVKPCVAGAARYVCVKHAIKTLNRHRAL